MDNRSYPSFGREEEAGLAAPVRQGRHHDAPANHRPKTQRKSSLSENVMKAAGYLFSIVGTACIVIAVILIAASYQSGIAADAFWVIGGFLAAGSQGIVMGAILIGCAKALGAILEIRDVARRLERSIR